MVAVVATYRCHHKIVATKYNWHPHRTRWIFPPKLFRSRPLSTHRNRLAAFASPMVHQHLWTISIDWHSMCWWWLFYPPQCLVWVGHDFLYHRMPSSFCQGHCVVPIYRWEILRLLEQISVNEKENERKIKNVKSTIFQMCGHFMPFDIEICE